MRYAGADGVVDIVVPHDGGAISGEDVVAYEKGKRVERALSAMCIFSLLDPETRAGVAALTGAIGYGEFINHVEASDPLNAGLGADFVPDSNVGLVRMIVLFGRFFVEGIISRDILWLIAQAIGEAVVKTIASRGGAYKDAAEELLKQKDKGQATWFAAVVALAHESGLIAATSKQPARASIVTISR